jgi:hypothetical protein
MSSGYAVCVGRIIVALFAVVLFGAALYYTTLAESGVQCEVCVDFGGGSNCQTASAPDRPQAIQQATATACANLSSGVTAGMQCNRTPPSITRCRE